MKFDLDRSVEVLTSTPTTLRSMLLGLSGEWAQSSDDPDSWQPFDVLGHLIHGEETDWIPRARIILAQGSDRTFLPFDRVAQFERSKGKTLVELIDEFARLRTENLEILRSWELVEDELDLEGTHPELGSVTLRQLLATWVVHDLTHVRQIATVLALKYDGQVGPWREYLSILK
jgi:hypothetical protein